MTVLAPAPDPPTAADPPAGEPRSSRGSWMRLEFWTAGGDGSRSALIVGAVGLAVLLMVQMTVRLAPEGAYAAAWFPAAGVSAGVVAVSTGRRRTALLVTIGLAGLAGLLLEGRPVSVAICCSLAGVGEAALAGWLLSRPDGRRLVTMPDLGRLVAVAGSAALIPGVVSAVAVGWFLHRSGWPIMAMTTVAHATGMLVLLPLAMRSPGRVASVRRRELFAQTAVAVTVTAFVFAPSQHLSFPFLVLVILMWAGLRLGSRVASVELFVLGGLATALTKNGFGPFAAADRVAGAVSGTTVLQVFLLTCTLMVLGLAVTAAQREATLAEVSAGKLFLDTLIETMDVGLLAADTSGVPTMSNRTMRDIQSVSGAPVLVDSPAAQFGLFRADGVTPLPIAETPINRVLAEGDLHGAELVLAPPGETPRDLLVHGRQILDRHGTLLGAVIAVHDVTTLTRREAELQAALSALADQREFEQAVMEVVNAGVVACDATGKVVLRNAAQRRITGVLDVFPDGLQGLPAGMYMYTSDGAEIPATRTPLRRALAGEAMDDMQVRIAPPDRSAHDVVVTARAIHRSDGRLLGAVAAFTDVTADRALQAKLQESVAFHDALLAASPDLIDIVDGPTGKTIWYSRDLFSLLGYSEHDVEQMGEDAIATLVHPEDLAEVSASRGASQELADGEVQLLRYRARGADGQYRWLSRRLTPFIRADDGTVLQLVGVARDVTDAVEVKDQLTAAALHDPLTGLPNRRLLADRLGLALRRTERAGGEVAVLFCDLDGFKRVNDTAGHAAGDFVLSTTADRLRAVVRPQDTVARVGGDEFVVVLDLSAAGGTGDSTASGPRAEPADPRHAATVVAGRIIQALGRPIDLDGRLHIVTVSIGLTFAQAGEQPEEVLSDADSAMYKAKSRGKNRMEVYDTGLRADASARGRVESVLRRAVTAADRAPVEATENRPVRTDSAALTVAYQPILDLGTQRLIGVEALARLRDDQGVSITPDQFIPIAEETGLIAALGRHVLHTACADLAHWHADHPSWRNLGVSVNLSARQAGRSDLLETVTDALRRADISPGLLTLELTESVLLEAGASAMTVLHQIRALGVKIDIDDFGTGYASLRYLAELPVTGLKIDRSFTAGLPDDATSRTIVRAIAALARDLNLTCVAEGIETDAQLLALPFGLAGQGFLLGRPVSRAEIDARLRSADAGTVNP